MRRPFAPDYVRYLATALQASPAARDRMLSVALAKQRSPDSRLRVALLRSIAGYAGYSPETAAHSLHALAAEDPSTDIAAMASLRLADLESARSCQANVVELKRRLAKVADIEKKMDRNEH